MYPMTINPLQPAFSCGHFQPALVLPAPRELSDEEMDMVSGGLPFVIAPIVVAAAEIAAVAFVTGFATTLGVNAAEAAWRGISSVWGEEEQACR